MNKIVIYIVLTQIILSTMISIVGTVWYNDNQDQHYYLNETFSNAVNVVYSFFSYFLLLNTLLPISLVVTLEVVKILQALFMMWDARMYSAERDRPAKVSTTTINEELGMVRYIFSDKTGTLTRNIMEFKYLKVGTELYGQGAK